ncbi:DoxX family protein [Sediminibacterium goheungense]|uniref:Putative oxidoreductase n=1 Tax=Sediminibacterium goheungense TaxID=1086393 RepID=A0A4R6IUZ0_9BACT|nr:DoxX family protein [Sediminibacterium goheungense]TDO26440.1 putative oxidoreductase [Sediminibacterium goheungense]
MQQLTPRFLLVLHSFRIVLSLLLIIHGVVRLSVGGALHFGAYLEEEGIPAGNIIAYLLTFFEIVGGCLLALRVYTKWIVPVFLIEIILGLIMVHAKEGWFVVGYGRNGSEYSVLIIISLVLIWFSEDVFKKTVS